MVQRSKKIVINEAKLVFHNVDTNSIYKPPHELVYYFVKDDGTLGFIEDQFEGVSYFGGQYDKKKKENTFSDYHKTFKKNYARRKGEYRFHYGYFRRIIKPNASRFSWHLAER